jgi:hypothetical protein
MAMDDFDLLSDDNVSEYWKERKNSWECRLPIYNKEWNMVDFQAIGEISNSSSSFIRMGDNDYFMASVDEFLRRWVRPRVITDGDNVRTVESW